MRVALALTALLALAACNNDKSTTVTTSDGKEIKITADGSNSSDSGTITFEGENGEGSGKITFGDAASKQGLPLGMPVYPGGQVKSTFAGGDKDSMGGMASIMTKDASAKVVDFYKAEVEKRGFSIKSQSTSTMNKGTMSNFTAEDANKQSLVVTAIPSEDGGTVVTLLGGGKK